MNSPFTDAPVNPKALATYEELASLQKTVVDRYYVDAAAMGTEHDLATGERYLVIMLPDLSITRWSLPRPIARKGMDARLLSVLGNSITVD